MGVDRLTCGTALDIKLAPHILDDGRCADILSGLVKGFCDLGGMFMQFDVVDNRVLLEAQAHPELHRDLSVRISGWSARFVTLSKEWQQMIIERTTQEK